MFSNKSMNAINGYGEKEMDLSLSQQFVDNYEEILVNLIDECLQKISFMDSEEIKSHIKSMSSYYASDRRPVMGELVLRAYELLIRLGYPNEATEKQAYVLACVLELGISYTVIVDDIEDEGKVRFNKLCWHLKPEVGTLAINDCSILLTLIHELLQQNFSQLQFAFISSFVNKIFLAFAVSQHMDTHLANKRCYNDYTMENYYSMASKKQLFSISAPIIFAMFLLNKASDESVYHIQEICKELAIFKQIQNDASDSFCGGPKSPTDIQKGKCSWLAVKALEICSEEQRNTFEKCYGSWDPTNVKAILDLYDDLKLSELVAEEKRVRQKSF